MKIYRKLSKNEMDVVTYLFCYDVTNYNINGGTEDIVPGFVNFVYDIRVYTSVFWALPQSQNRKS